MSVTKSRYSQAIVPHHVLSKALRQARQVTLLDEVAQRERVLVAVAAGEALIGHVEEGVVLALLHDLAQLPPLILGRVDARRVVRARVQQHDAVARRLLQVGHHALKVQPDGVLVVVPVLLDAQARVLEDGRVVGPARRGQVDGLGVRVEAREEGAADAQRARARDGLGGDDAVLPERRRVGAVGQRDGRLGEGGHARDARVLLVARLGDDLLLGGAHRGQHVGLALVVACRVGAVSSQLTYMPRGKEKGKERRWHVR